jgi:OFA family oxalate/formate antiporter-like MFS transporter
MTMTGAYLLRNPPPGYVPPGWDPSKLRGVARAGADVHASVMVRMPTFWSLWIAYCLGTTAGTMVISQLIPFARNAGHTSAVAAFALTVGALGSASGRVLSGWMSDYAGRVNTLRIMLLISACAMPLLYLFRENVALFYALLFAVYYCYGTQLSVNASTSADFFGTKNVGFNYGLLLLAWGVAAILGPFLGGRVYVATGEYRYAFFVAAAMSIAALATLSFARSPHEQPVQAVARA